MVVLEAVLLTEVPRVVRLRPVRVTMAVEILAVMLAQVVVALGPQVLVLPVVMAAPVVVVYQIVFQGLL